MKKRSFRDFLKVETHDHRLRLESSSRVMRADFSIDEYKALLIKWHAFYVAFEELLERRISTYPNLNDVVLGRPKVPMLMLDLDYFQLATSYKFAATVRTFFHTSFESRSSVLGALYVLEGSTLTALIISEHLIEKFQFLNEDGITFYAGYGAKTGANWTQFAQAFDLFIVSTDERIDGALAANRVFEFLGHFLSSENIGT